MPLCGLESFMLLPLLKGEAGRGLLLWDVDQDGCPAGTGLLAFPH